MSLTEHPAIATPGVAPGNPYVEVVIRRQTTNGLALTSMVLGILWLAGLGSLLAVIFASIAKTQVRASEGWQTGDGMATAGLVLGIIGLAPIVLVAVIALGAALDG